MPRLEGMGLLGERVCLYFADADRWYDGRVDDFDPDPKSFTYGHHYIHYDDGDKRWHSLEEELASQQLRWPSGVWPSGDPSLGRPRRRRPPAAQVAAAPPMFPRQEAPTSAAKKRKAAVESVSTDAPKRTHARPDSRSQAPLPLQRMPRAAAKLAPPTTARSGDDKDKDYVDGGGSDDDDDDYDEEEEDMDGADVDDATSEPRMEDLDSDDGREHKVARPGRSSVSTPRATAKKKGAPGGGITATPSQRKRRKGGDATSPRGDVAHGLSPHSVAVRGLPQGALAVGRGGFEIRSLDGVMPLITRDALRRALKLVSSGCHQAAARELRTEPHSIRAFCKEACAALSVSPPEGSALAGGSPLSNDAKLRLQQGLAPADAEVPGRLLVVRAGTAVSDASGEPICPVACALSKICAASTSHLQSIISAPNTTLAQSPPHPPRNAAQKSQATEPPRRPVLSPVQWSIASLARLRSSMPSPARDWRRTAGCTRPPTRRSRRGK